MNGRAYDYNLGRFLSVDPFIQAPGNSQSMNPYSYIMNNPLSGTDPSGYRSICRTQATCKTIPVNPYTLSAISVAWKNGKPSALVFTNKNDTKIASIGNMANNNKKGDEQSIYHAGLGRPIQSTGSTEIFVDEYGTTHYGGWGVNWHAYKKGWLETGELDPDVTSLFNSEEARSLPNFAVAYDSYVNANRSIKSAQAIGTLQYLSVAGIGNNIISKATNWLKSFIRTGIRNGSNRALVQYWPIRNGFIGKTKTISLEPGTLIDRYGGSEFSRFFSPINTPAKMRALPPGSANSALKTFEVMKEFQVTSGRVAPAFDQIGLGVQYHSPRQLGELLDLGILREVTK